MNDSKIIDLFFERSEQAIVELADLYGNQAMHIAENVLHNAHDAEECVNDAYLSVWNNIPPNRPSHLQAYLYKIVKNIALNRFDYNTSKKRNSNFDIALDELQDCIPAYKTVETEVMEHELRDAINAFLGTLSKEDRISFVARYWMGESVEKIAEKMGYSSRNIAVRLFRVRAKLKKYLKGSGYYEKRDAFQCCE